ncbi:MAG: hypothetical protein CVV27_02440 [Candidatus Melainabacteria bacterium HGW-Melainabacteria-1]|nr:MAG: hypothetical protein CVV27_02440 [Candidatus Melainabacteria bacterium HGW-Melainabacteria-1]
MDRTCLKLFARLCLASVLLAWPGVPALAQPVPVPSPTPTSAPATPGQLKVNYTADRVEYLQAEGIARLIGNVDLKVRDMQIKTERLEFDQVNNLLRSDVPFEMIQTPKDQKPRTLRGKSFIYNIALKRIEAEEVYLVIPAQMPGQEVYIQGDWMTAYNDGERVVMRNGFFTTCNHYAGQLEDGGEDPYTREAVRQRATHYAVEGEIMDYIQDDRLLVWNAQVLTFENNAFWFPFWYVPLQGPPGFQRPDIDAGQNPVEGMFVRFKGYYQWNEFHDGYWYLTAMEKKGIGVGFQHDWVAFPNSITRLYFYGLPVTQDLIGLPGAIFSMPNRAEELAQEQGLATQQLPSPPLQPRNFGDYVSQYLSDKFEDHQIELRHRQLLLPHMQADLVYTDNDIYNISAFTAQRNPQRTFDLTLADTEIFPLDRFTDLNLDTNLQLRQGVNSPVETRFDRAQNTLIETTRTSQTQSRTASFSARIGEANLSLRSNWNDNFNKTNTQIQSLSPTPSPGASPATEPQQVNIPAPTGNENWNSSLDFKTNLNERTNLSANLVYNSNVNGIGNASTPQGTLQQTLQPRLNLTQTHDWGSVAMNYEDFLDLSPTLDLNRNSGQVKKLPELDLRFNPFFQESFPFQLDSTVGRYFDPASVVPGSSLNEIGRTRLRMSLSPKDFDLGLGNKLNVGGSSFEQRFYQTLDAEYILTGRVNFRNDFSKYFVPNFTYERAIQDLVNNNSPFQNFEPLGLRLVNNLNVDLRFVNLPEFTMNLTGGYDYLNRVYQPIRANILSEIGGRFALRANTGYTFVNIRDEDVGKPMLDIDRNVYRHGPCAPNGCTVQVEDVGSLMSLGGRWENTTLGMRWRSTDYELNIGNLNTFGLETGIPEGFELGGDIAFDFHQGKVNALNTMLRMKLGSTWQWHTEIDLIASLQPLSVAHLGKITQAIEIPFRVVVRKDLHDFILTASWDSFYQQFNLNLQLLAFPYSTSDLLGNVGNLNQQLNTLTVPGR